MKNIFRVAFFCLMVPYLNAQIKVSDYGAFPNDNKDDLKAIQKAVEALKSTKNKTLVFEKGIYDLQIGDVSKVKGIDIHGQHGVTFLGVADKNGPQTTLLRHYEVRNNVWGKNILQVVGCDDFTLKNFIIDNKPRYTSAGEVIKNDGKSIVVKIFEGNPIIDGTMFYCANAWDLESKTLLPIESITYGAEVSRNPEEYTWHIVDENERTMILNSPTAAAKVKVGYGLSWHFGYNGIQVSFNRCNNLHVENVTTYNAIGFCMEALMCGNITSKNVRVEAPDNQLAVGSRDGWKIYASNGNVVMDKMYMEGVRWDGQNVHGSFAFVHKILDDRTVWFKKKHSRFYGINEGTSISFSKDNLNSEARIVENCQKRKVEGNFAGFVVRFTEPIPEFVNEQTIGMVSDWNTESYVLKNSTFKNIAGSASILRNSNSVVKNNSFSHIMYPLTIGGAIKEGEGVVPQNVTISNNTFINSGWVSRHTKKGAIVLSNWKAHNNELSPFMKNIEITHNTIENCEIGLNINDVDGVFISKNTFENVSKEVVLGNAINITGDYKD